MLLKQKTEKKLKDALATHSISEKLWVLLQKHRLVKIPSIGILDLQEIKQYISQDTENTIASPFYILQFSKNKTAKYIISSQLEQKIMKELDKNDKLPIGDFTMERKEVDNELKFEITPPDPIEQDNLRMPAVTIRPLQRDDIQHAKRINQPPVQPKSAPTVNTTSTSSYTPPPITEETSENNMSKWLTIGGFGMLALLLAWGIYALMNRTSQTSVEPQKTVSQNENPTNNEIDAVAEIDPKYEGILTPEILNSGCVIIVGAFQQQRNAQPVIDKIQHLGYQLYQANHNGLTRVGVQFDCSQEDLDSYLAQVRGELQPQAWYLIPEGYRPGNQ